MKKASERDVVKAYERLGDVRLVALELDLAEVWVRNVLKGRGLAKAEKGAWEGKGRERIETSQEIVCEECGDRIETDWLWCPYCGKGRDENKGAEVEG